MKRNPIREFVERTLITLGILLVAAYLTSIFFQSCLVNP